jgi:hypothetical protein
MLLFFTINILAQQKTAPKKTTPAKSITKVKPDSSKCPFSEKELDLNIEQLPQNYVGNDLQAITAEVIKKGTFVKNEFETTAQFKERSENEKRKFLVGELNYNSLLAFSDHSSLPFTYNADNQLMSINLSLGYRLFISISCQSNKLLTANTFFYNKDGLSFFYNSKKDLLVDIEAAKILKPNLRTLYIGKLGDPIGKFHTRPNLWKESAQNHLKKVIERTTEKDTAEVMFNAAKRHVERSKELFEQNVISKLDYNYAIDEYENAKAALEDKKTTLKRAQMELVLYLNDPESFKEKESPALNIEVKEIWVYDISTGNILFKQKLF